MVGTSTPRLAAGTAVKNRTLAEIHADALETATLVAARPIRDSQTYELALELIGWILRGPHDSGTPGGNVLEVLATLVEKYEEDNVPDLGDATPQEVVTFMAEQKDIAPAELAELMGGRSRLSEFMTGKRELSREQIKKLRSVLGVSADLLIGALVAFLAFAAPHLALAI